MIKSTKLLLILITCSSCAWLTGPEGYFPTNEYEFLEETSEAPIITPEGLFSPNSDNHYPYFSAFEVEKDLDIPKPRQIFSSGGESSVQLRRLGELMWVYIETLPSTTWPISKNYWDTSIYTILSADPDSGVIRIDFNEQFELEMKIEHGIKESSSEIFLNQISKESNEIVSNPEFIQSELGRVVEYLAESVDIFTGTSLAAQNLNERKKANIFTENGQTIIELDLNFDRAWSSVSKALASGNIVSNDRDRSNGIFFVSYGLEEEEGMFSFLGFGNSQKESDFNKDSQFEVIISQKNNKTYVRAKSLNGNIDESEQLLSKINELLN
ncbi:outer membrane protein assembly factor BamC [Gammaproteobacteria bacterium]|nr:outer membrane protein assembly factor BamC [Gammaproteobacteria bacterium]